MERVTRKQLLAIATAIVAKDIDKAQTLCRRIGSDDASIGTYRYFGERFADWLDDTSAKPSGQIFTKGNSKLPFFKFSALPIVTCPGAGACSILRFCYSLKSWRNPSAFFAQCRNTVLILEQSQHLVKAWHKLPKGVPVRLYVDGDFDSLETLEFWWRLLRAREDLQAYGYSKSFDILESYTGAWPTNYKLNLSSGANRPQSDKLRNLPITRGDFIALPIAKYLANLPNNERYSSADYKRALRLAGKAAGIEKAFLCPGKCGSCIKRGTEKGTHACGLASFQDIPILIGIH